MKMFELIKCYRRMDSNKALLVKSLRELLTITAWLQKETQTQISSGIRSMKQGGNNAFPATCLIKRAIV